MVNREALKNRPSKASTFPGDQVNLLQTVDARALHDLQEGLALGLLFLSNGVPTVWLKSLIESLTHQTPTNHLRLPIALDLPVELFGNVY